MTKRAQSPDSPNGAVRRSFPSRKASRAILGFEPHFRHPCSFYAERSVPLVNLKLGGVLLGNKHPEALGDRALGEVWVEAGLADRGSFEQLDAEYATGEPFEARGPRPAIARPPGSPEETRYRASDRRTRGCHRHLL
jgi:hypothetical protein